MSHQFILLITLQSDIINYAHFGRLMVNNDEGIDY